MVYMKQAEGFSSSANEHLVCKLNKSMYSLKQASRQWYLKFHEVISSFGFEENVMDNYIYHKVSGSKICYLVLYMDDIFLATNDVETLYEVKQFLSNKFDMKDMGEASYVIGIKISRHFGFVSRDLYQQSLREISDENFFTKSNSHSEG